VTAISTVLNAYGAAWLRWRVIVGLYLALQLAIYALLAPVLGTLINLAVSLSAQPALTDQDIAGFLLTPGGFVVTVSVVSLLLVVEVLGFAMMAAIWRAGGQNSLNAARTAFVAVAKRARPLLIFAGLLVLRVLALALPFVLAGLLIAWWLLTAYDINYYLTNRPPEAFVAGAAIGLLLLAMAVLLLFRLTGWALALHLVVFDTATPAAAFAKSVQMMDGHRWRLQREVVIWVGIRVAAMAVVGACAAAILHLMPLQAGTGLRFVLAVTLAVVALWGLAGAVVSAVSLGALAWIVDAFFPDGKPLDPIAAASPITMRRRLSVALAGLAALIGIGFWSGAELLDGLSTEDNVAVIAHRGAAGSRPENTLASVAQAIEDGADWIEIDVQETADGQVVVIHDSDFMKLSGNSLKIWDATMEDLARIDIGSWFDPIYSDQRTPLLRDVLKMAKGKAKVLIELKYYGHDVDLENRVARIVEDLGMVDQIATMSLDYGAVQKMQALRPDWRTGVLAATAVGNLAGLAGDFVAVNTGQASPRLARDMADTGSDLYVWTVNDPLQMSKMISMGATGLITDEPALARRVLQIRADLSTPERLVLWLSEELGLTLNTKRYRDESP